MLIDTHAHLDDNRLINDVDNIIKECKKEDMKIIVNCGSDIKSSKKSIELSSKIDIVYATVGIHPHDAKYADNNAYTTLKSLCKKDKVVAIGEIGLDYYYNNSPKEIQKEVFVSQIDIAVEERLPIVVHSREAHQDTYDILKSYKNNLIGVLHSFSGSWEMAKLYIDMGYYISFSGPITFKNSKKLPDVAYNIPLDRLLIETDCPYLTPTPFRGKVNYPYYVKYIAEKIAEIKDVSMDELMLYVYENTLNLFSKIKTKNNI